MAEVLPTIFFGHGNPMNAVLSNGYTDGWQRLGKRIPRPKAILSISAHWFVPGTGVTIGVAPRTIHDFGGFPRELYQVQYPAPGDPELARRGTWAVLRHVYPNADVPVVQLSIDERQSASFHFEIGRKLAPLRGERILIVGSGNLVHNLHAYAWGRHMPEPYDWAIRFEKQAKEIMVAGQYKSLIDYETLGPDAMLSIPTPDHYLPLLYVLGARQPVEPITFPIEGVDGGSVSMLAVLVGGA
jgi:4,5-DOPA dioxygenase extradiol